MLFLYPDDQSGERFRGCAVGENSCEPLVRQPQMIPQHALEHGAQVGGRLEIAALIEVGGFETRPIRDDSTASDSPARQKCDRTNAMIGADCAIDMHGTAKFSDGDDGCILPPRSKFALERGNRPIEAAKKIVDAFLHAKFEGGRHERRVLKMDSHFAPANLRLQTVDPEIATAISQLPATGGCIDARGI